MGAIVVRELFSKMDNVSNQKIAHVSTTKNGAKRWQKSVWIAMIGKYMNFV